MELEEANRNGQQLFFADMERRLRPRHSRQEDRRHAALTRPPQLLAPVQYRQLVLFPPHERDLRRGQQRGFPEVDAPGIVLAWEAAADDYARHHGLKRGAAFGLRRGLRILLALQDTPGAPVRATDVVPLSRLHLPVKPILKLLTEVGMLDDDRIPRIVTWFHEQTASLPEPMVGELTAWFELVLSGATSAPRVKARPHQWIHKKVYEALPALRTWAADGKESLRSVTRADVLAVLPGGGTPRVAMLQGLRHILRLLKRRGLIFTDPTSQISGGSTFPTVPLPVQVADLREPLKDEATPRAALAALIIFHGLTSKELQTVLTTDLGDGRLFLKDRTVLLATEVRTRLEKYRAYRTTRWPLTANPHLFISKTTACGTGRVSHVWINDTLGIPARRLREDRLLHEAASTGGDPRRICDLFGLSVGAALRYTSTLDQPGIVEYRLRNSGSRPSPYAPTAAADSAGEAGPDNPGPVPVR
ncbi:hypothetical protein AB0D38_03270 [Streptomyces sp. NPDC048279]|uniref:hypothetical protein n=1 Tax=Streptomyces sp. NPDC048279 TaxID=3154714 RepID=UPI003445E4B5